MRFDRHCLELSNSGRNSHVVSECIPLRNTAKAQAFKIRVFFAYSLAATFVISANFGSSFVGTCGTRDNFWHLNYTRFHVRLNCDVELI
jgi:hypothetical protein